MSNSIEKCVAWSVQIAQGSLESAQTTINRAQRLHALIDEWIDGVDDIKRHRAELEKKLDGQVDLEDHLAEIRKQVNEDAKPPRIPEGLASSDQTPAPRHFDYVDGEIFELDPSDAKTRLVRHVEALE